MFQTNYLLYVCVGLVVTETLSWLQCYATIAHYSDYIKVRYILPVSYSNLERFHLYSIDLFLDFSIWWKTGD